MCEQDIENGAYHSHHSQLLLLRSLTSAKMTSLYSTNSKLLYKHFRSKCPPNNAHMQRHERTTALAVCYTGRTEQEAIATMPAQTAPPYHFGVNQYSC